MEEGGGTDFPDLGITVMPKKGSALLWPSIYDSDPMESDPRMRHQALPVKAGIKFATNGWIHMYDYVGPQVSLKALFAPVLQLTLMLVWPHPRISTQERGCN